jgi:glutaconate CoA-transferase subunit A
MQQPNKVRSLDEAISLISDGSIVALAGVSERRHPMAAIREIIRQRRRNLHVVGCCKSISMDLLVAAGCAAATEPHATDRLRAGALGLSMLPLRDDARADFAPRDAVRPFADPFTGQTAMAVQALAPDVAIIHAHRADASGNVQLALGHGAEDADYLMIARAARAVIVTVEQIVSDEAVARRPAETILSASEVTCVVEAPFGAHPYGLDGRYTGDAAHLERCQAATTCRASLAAWLSDHVTGVADHWGYLDRIGTHALMSISLDRAARM